MSNARICDGPSCDHIGTGNPEGWLSVGVSTNGRLTNSELAGSFDFATVECFAAWLAQYQPPAPEPEIEQRAKRPTAKRKRATKGR